MDKFTIYCTEEQTKKALELGAPIKYVLIGPIGKDTKKYLEPTAEQMIGWMEEQKSFSNICVRKTMGGNHSSACYCNGETLLNKVFSSRKEATIAAIDAALEYLKSTKQE